MPPAKNSLSLNWGSAGLPGPVAATSAWYLRWVPVPHSGTKLPTGEPSVSVERSMFIPAGANDGDELTTHSHG